MTDGKAPDAYVKAVITEMKRVLSPRMAETVDDFSLDPLFLDTVEHAYLHGKTPSQCADDIISIRGA
jgi:hypothetical protein